MSVKVGRTNLGYAKDLRVEELDDNTGALEVISPEGRPIEVKNKLGHPVETSNGYGRLNISASSDNVLSPTGASADDVVVPVKGARYIMKAVGNTFFVCQDGTAALGVAGIPILAGETFGPVVLNRDLSVYAPTAVGYFYLIRIVE